MNKHLSIYVTKKEHELLKEASAFYGLTISGFMRNLALVKARQILNSKKEESQD